MRKELFQEIPPGLYPAFRVAVLFSLGILAASAGVAATEAWTAVFLMLTGLIIISELSGRIRYAGKLQTMPVILYLLFLPAAGAVWYHVSDRKNEPPELNLTLLDESVQFHGHVLSARLSAAGNTQAEMRIDSVRLPHGQVWPVSFITMARSFEGDMPEIREGNYLRFTGTITEPGPPRNPAGFDYQAFLQSRGIYTITRIDRIESTFTRISRLSWVYWRLKVRQFIQTIFSGDNAALARALLMGDRSALERDLQTAFSRAGLAHLMAVSGMHVGFILLPIWLLIPRLWTFRSGRLAGMVLVLTILFFYCGITGFSTSVVRASVMSVLFVYGKLFQKMRESVNLLGVAALVLLLINPRSLFEIGFQLSFSAVFIILTVLPAGRNLLPYRYRFGKVASLTQFVGISLFVQCGLYPILIYYFNEFSIIGPLSNTIAVPFVQFMFLLSLVCIPLTAAHAGFASWLNTPSDWIMGALNYYAVSAAASDWSWIQTNLSSSLYFLIWPAGFLLFTSLFKPSLRFKMLILLLASLCVHQAVEFHKERNPALTITVFDVGQGDAILLETPSGKNVLYDTGILSLFQNSAERVLLPEINARGIRELHAVILSHPHADHIGGISTLIKSLPIHRIYHPGFDYDSRTYQNFIRDARDADIPLKVAGQGEIIEIDPHMRFYVTGPYSGLRGNDPNTWSLVVKAVYGQTSVLLTGDADMQSENKMVEFYGNFLQSDVLKAGHHGSHTSSGIRFLEKVNPSYTAVSLARRNRYSHPHPEAMRRLHASGTKVLFTSLDGALVFTSDGQSFERVNWRAN